MSLIKVETVIASCHDKTGLKELAAAIAKSSTKARFLSSSGTFQELQGIVPVTEVSEYTGFPEMPSGLVKTLHPKVHAGILADLEDKEQAAYLRENRALPVDMVIANLYPFQRFMKADFETARRNIDVGGVAMIEASLKNCTRVAVLVSPADYNAIAGELQQNRGALSISTRIRLAKTAANYLADYLAAISLYFRKLKA